MMRMPEQAAPPRAGNAAVMQSYWAAPSTRSLLVRPWKVCWHLRCCMSATCQLCSRNLACLLLPISFLCFLAHHLCFTLPRFVSVPNTC